MVQDATWTLPGLDGFSVCAQIRARSVRAHHRASHHLENAAPNPPSDMARYNPGFVHTALAFIARGRTRAAVSNDTTLAAMPGRLRGRGMRASR